MSAPMLVDGKVWVLRTCGPDGLSHGGFRWPLGVGAEVVAPDWDPDPNRACGGGLHGLLWGAGDAGLLSLADDAVWMVVAVDPADVANMDAPGKVRFRAGVVHAVGSRDAMTGLLVAQGAPAVVFGTATAGDYGTATAGNEGTATAGVYGTATVGDGGTATVGNRGIATAGDYGTATAGNEGTATAGDGGTAIAGDGGTATVGNWGTATAGVYGTATVGDGGTATVGNRGIATAGNWGTVIVKWRDGDRYRLAVGYVGEDGIEPSTPYRCDNSGRLVVAS